ncbi:MAG: hypothetical protein NT105_17700 [Verrucomicrobia bacterium]|nr:hypothetical protein [Verrucomicrobiota bacterium]
MKIGPRSDGPSNAIKALIRDAVARALPLLFVSFILFSWSNINLNARFALLRAAEKRIIGGSFHEIHPSLSSKRRVP